jgi:uncharacterized membrane protein
MRQKNLDFLLVLLITAVSVIWVFIPNHPPVIGVIWALPLVFVIPGYAVVEALFVDSPDQGVSFIRRPELKTFHPFNGSDRLILSLGLSLAMVIITGFVLNMLPMGLEQTTWTISLTLLTALLSFIALYRRQKVKKKLYIANVTEVVASRFRISFYEYILFLLAIVIVISSVWYSLISAQQQQQQSAFTQFWMVPSKQGHNSCAMLIGMQSFETAPVTYDVVVTANGVTISSWPAVVLTPQSQWYQSVALQPGNTNTLYVEAKLYRTDKPRIVYRNVHTTLNNSQGSSGRALVC